MRSILDKRGAIELSMTTVVVIVLSMTMLALGLTLIRTLFVGATITATSLNNQIQTELNKVFQSDTTKVGIISEQGLLAPARGQDSCAWWAIVSDSNSKYHYTFSVTPNECGDTSKGYTLTKSNIERFFLTGLSGDINLAANEKQQYCLRFNVPSNAPSCLFSVDLAVTKIDPTTGIAINYGSSRVDIRPKAATLFG